MRKNPFNDNRPVDGDALYGRAAECKEIDYYLVEALQGSCFNLALVGKPRMGKKSLLNYAKHKAEKFDIVVVNIPGMQLAEPTVDQAIRVWLSNMLEVLRDRYALDLGFVSFDEQGVSKPVLPGSPTGPPITDIRWDDLYLPLQTILAQYNTKLLVAIDDIDHGASNVHALKNLLSLSAGLPMMLVVTCEETFFANQVLGQTMASRFKLIRVERFRDRSQTNEVIRSSISDVCEPGENVVIDPKVIDEIHLLSAGHPQHVATIGHHITKAYVQETIERFEIMPMVSGEITGQLPGILDHSAAEAIRRMSTEELKEFVGLVQHTQLTVEREVLATLALDKITPVAFQNTEQRVRQRRDKFAELGLINIDGDRFNIVDEDWTRSYLSFRLRKILGRSYALQADSGPYSYSDLVLKKLADFIKRTCQFPTLVNMRRIPKDFGLSDQMKRIKQQIARGLTENSDALLINIAKMVQEHPATETVCVFRCSVAGPQPDGGRILEVIAVAEQSAKAADTVRQVLEDAGETLKSYCLQPRAIEIEQLFMPEIERLKELRLAYEKISPIVNEFEVDFVNGNWDTLIEMTERALAIATKANEEAFIREWTVMKGFALICLQRRQDAMQDAMEVLRPIAESQPTDTDILIAKVNLAFLYLDAGEYAEARKLLSDVITGVDKLGDINDVHLMISFGPDDPLLPDNVDAKYNLLMGVSLKAVSLCMSATIKCYLGECLGALRDIQAAKRLDRNRGYPGRVEARLLVLLKHYDLAANALNVAKALDPQLEDVIVAEQVVLYQLLDQPLPNYRS